MKTPFFFKQKNFLNRIRNIKSMKILYFTGTGNSLYVAKEIGGDLLSIPQLIKNNQYTITDDIVGFVIPCYYYSIPRIVEEYIKKTTINADYVFVILTYGSIVAAAMTIIENLLQDKGFNHYYLNKILMVDNFLPVYEMAYEKKVKTEEMINEQIIIIKQDIQNHKDFNVDTNIPDYESSIFYNFTDEDHLDNIDKKYILNENLCNLCGICSKVCPINNISIKEDKLVFNHHCEWCMACIHHCPRLALHIKGELSDERFLNNHVDLSEIINSNR
jgi:ferredoxin